MLRSGTHYRITPGYPQTARYNSAVVDLVNCAAPARAIMFNGTWRPQRSVSSYVAVPLDLAKAATATTASRLGKPGHPHRKPQRARLHNSSKRKTPRHVASGAAMAAIDGASNTESDFALPAASRMPGALETGLAFTSMDYNGILGCVCYQKAAWANFHDLYGVAPFVTQRLRGGCAEHGIVLEPEDSFLVIDQLAVAPPVQKLGIGAALLKEAIAYAAAQGMDYVYTYTTDDYPGSDVWWQKQQFVEVSRHVSHYGIGPPQEIMQYVLKL